MQFGPMTLTPYFSADCMYNEVQRRAALVSLTADSEAGHISYTAGVTFFPHTADDDFAVSYDAAGSKVLYDGTGRRSKKREQKLRAGLQSAVDELAVQLGGTVHWDSPLQEARLG